MSNKSPQMSNKSPQISSRTKQTGKMTKFSNSLIKKSEFLINKELKIEEFERESINRKVILSDLINIDEVNKIPVYTGETEIPLNIFTHWHSKILPPKMTKHVEKFKRDNFEFNINIYDNNDCRIMIQKYFTPKVLDAFDSLIPNAFKADLWRLCVCYLFGGIYMDIKFGGIDGFKMINLTHRENFVMERKTYNWYMNSFGIWNGLIITKPRNNFLIKCINKIVINVENNNPGFTDLYPTGPGLLGLIYFKDKKINLDNFELKLGQGDGVLLNNKYIIYQYEGYLSEKPQKYYSLWKQNKIYAKKNIDNLELQSKSDCSVTA